MPAWRDRENCRWNKGIQPQPSEKNDTRPQDTQGSLRWPQLRRWGYPGISRKGENKTKNHVYPAYTGELFSTILPLGTQGQPVLPTVQYFTCQWPQKWQGWTKVRKHSLSWNSSWQIQGRARGAQTLAAHKSSVKSQQIIFTQSCDSLITRGRAILQ